MSEAILKALIQMFALIAKQDGGIEDKELQYVESFLISQLGAEASQPVMLDFKKQVGLIEDEKTRRKRERDRLKQLELASDPEKLAKEEKDAQLTSVRESVKILGLCKRINKTINNKQKIVVFVRLYELVNTSKKFTPQRMAIINTAGEVFNFTADVINEIKTFVTESDSQKLDYPAVLVIRDEAKEDGFKFEQAKSINCEGLDSDIYILRQELETESGELYFMRYNGSHDVYLNGSPIFSDRIYAFAPGATLKMTKGRPIYYSDVVATFQADKTFSNLSFNVTDLEFRFPNNAIGLRNINFSECQGRLVGIMGASGAGKTTLLNVLSGITSPYSGSVKINGIDLHREKEKLEGVIGLIPQDDLLIEELTVFENLYFSAKFCFKDMPENEIRDKVDTVLKSLGLYDRKDLKVGNSLNKLISGGQRKRLNIALELIREPSILFVDEPTSGLSSRDSENVMDLLSELTLKGKLIFVVIHQPSSQIYKMFDKMIILDTGGYMVYYGHPTDAISYFKTIDGQVKSEEGECPHCGNATPEVIFDIIEARKVNEFGSWSNERKIEPATWEEFFHKNITPEVIPDVTTEPPKNLKVPNWFNQFVTYFRRDFKSKISNLQYVFLNLIEAPLLGFILSFLIRYTAANKPHYIFYENENIVPYIFMSIIVALFLGLTVSAEEIFRDRKILKREEFLNLSRSSYLIAKVVILVMISAIQSFLYIMVGNSILQFSEPSMYLSFWLILFPMWVLANMMGLNISSAFNSAVTIYVLIPLLMIPQMALGGSMFSFDKLNQIIGSVGKVPIVAEMMPSRWAYEALMVKQFRDNMFERNFYEYEKHENYCNFKQVYYVKELRNANDLLSECYETITDEDFEYSTEEQKNQIVDSIKNQMEDALALLKTEIADEQIRLPEFEVDFDLQDLVVDQYNGDIHDRINNYIDQLDHYYGDEVNKAHMKIESRKEQFENKSHGLYNRFRDKYHNEKLQDIVTNVYEKKKIIRYENRLIQQENPVFLDADNSGFFGFRAHFYAPNKWFCGRYYDTFYFNMVILWLFCVVFYVTLYFDLLKKGVDWAGNFSFKSQLEKLLPKKKAVAAVEETDKKAKEVSDKKTALETEKSE
ncbi:MAG: ATP-binding cassette domain-containing protein [Bacteroidales bacterium]|nr:ATP-binding cassette domain-containing protein [Bacteroidales bacterium]